MTTSVNIVEYYSSKLATHETSIKEHEAALKKVQSKIDALPKQREAINAKRAEKNKFKSVAEAEGLDTSPIVAHLAALDAEERALQDEELALKQELASHAEPVPEMDFDTLMALAKLLADEGLKHADVVATIDDCMTDFWLGDIKHDGYGMLESCEVQLDGRCKLNVPIAACEERCLVGFTPKHFMWLPLCRAAAMGVVEGERPELSPTTIRSPFGWNERSAWIIEGSCTLVVSSDVGKLFESFRKRISQEETTKRPELGTYNQFEYEDFLYPDRKGPTHRWLRLTPAECEQGKVWHAERIKARLNEIDQAVNQRIEALMSHVTALDALLCKKLEEAPNGLDLSADYSGDVFKRELQSELLESTTLKPLFRFDGLELNSKETFERIKAEWQAFVAAPWSSALKGSHAKLKYICEGGERPRFWCDDYANTYGFIIRTRDHSWIRGHIFIDETESGEASDPRIEVHFKENSYRAMKIGRMYVTTYETNE